MFQFTGIAREETGLAEGESFDPVKSAEAAALLMSKYLKQANGDLNEAITAYNAGFGTINKWKKGTGDLSKENREYAIKVNTHRARYLGGEIYTPGAGAQGGAQYGVRGPLPDNAVIDQSTGLAFTPGDSPFEKGGLVDKIGNAVGVNDLVNKFMNGRGMRREVVQGTLEERARGKGTATAAGNVYVDTPMPVEEARPVANNSSYFDQLGAQMGIDGLFDKLRNSPGMRKNNAPEPASTSLVTTAANDLQQPTGRMQIDGQVISDLGGSGAKPTMQLADNTVSLDGETKRLFAQMMALFNPSESGDLLSRSNDAFIRGFMTQVGATQAAGLVTEDGRPTRQLVDRIQNAIFAKAYKDARLVRMVAEEPDPDMRNVLTALNAAANDFVQMQALSGEAHKQAVTTIVDGIETADSLDKKALAALKDAVDLVRQSKESGQHITDVIAQGDMFSETAPEVKALALFIVANNRSAKRMATAFKLMAQRINDELQHQGQALGDMFGGGDVSLQDILRQVSQELEYEGMQGISGGLFESVSGGSYNGVAPYTSLLLHRASGIKDIIHLIRLLSRTDPQDEQLVQVLAHFVRMPVADVKKWCRLFGISNSLLRGLLNHASSLGRDGFDEIAQAIKNGDMPPAIDWFSIRPTRVKAFLSAAHSASPLAEMVQRLSLIFTDHTALGDLTLDEMKEASIQWADQQNEVNSDFLPAFRKAVSKADDARGILKAFKALQSRVNKHVGDIDGVTAEGRDILKEHGITPEFIDEIRTDMQREVVSSLQIVARALADANPKSAAIVNRVIGDIEASEGIGALKLFLSRAFNPNGNILPGIIGEAKKYVSEEELEQLDQLLKRFSYNPQTRWQMNQRSMGSVHEKVLSAMNSAIANSSVSEEKALEWADSFITEEVEEARAGQNGGIDLRKELADIYRLTGGKISTLSKVVHHQGRAYANLNGVVAVNLNDENASALWHELGHHLEYSNPGLLEKARSFLKANVEGDKPSFVNIGGRGKPEWCFRSRLSNIYMAKVYPPASVSNTGKIRQKSPTISKTSATEVFSMALQLYHDKEAAAASLMNGDGLLELLLGVAKELNNAD